MNSTKIKGSFTNLLDDLKNNYDNVNPEFKYIGTGNPNSQILIIGKEAAVSIESEQYNTEILRNLEYWTVIEEFNFDGVEERNFSEYSPLYPYKGQILKKDNGKNWGTSTTWMNYQKLINKIYNVQQNERMDFHKKSFITEVNSTPSKQTKNATTKSIIFRKKHVLDSHFFRSFPIIIISGVGYFDTIPKPNEIEHIFKVTFTEKKFADNENKKQPYWIHWNFDKTKLVINTYQLSIGVSEQLLNTLAEEIQKSGLLIK